MTPTFPRPPPLLRWGAVHGADGRFLGSRLCDLQEHGRSLHNEDGDRPETVTRYCSALSSNRYRTWDTEFKKRDMRTKAHQAVFGRKISSRSLWGFELFTSLTSSSADPKFIAAHLIPDNADRDNDKVYFFFTEKATEEGDREGAIHTRVGRVCAVRCLTACLCAEVYFVAQHVMIFFPRVYSINV